MRRAFACLAACGAIIAAAAPVSAASKFKLQMSGAQEVPGPGDPDGSAQGVLVIDPATNKVSWNFTYGGIATPTLMHIHTGAAGVSGPVLVNLGVATTGGPGTLLNTTTTTAANVNTILANPPGFYVNIHNSPFPAGAVRGQLMPLPPPACPGDFNGDGQVDGADLGVALGGWGVCGNCADCPADLNDDCMVDGADLGVLLGNWGPCPLSVTGINPPSGTAGTVVTIEGHFPSSDPFDYCVVGVAQSPLAGDDFVVFMPFDVIEVIDNQHLVAEAGPLPDITIDAVAIMVQQGMGGAVAVENLFPGLIDFTPAIVSFGCWGGAVGGPGGIDWQINPAFVEPFGNCVCKPPPAGLCNYACYGQKLGGPASNDLCATIGPGPLAGGAFPAGTKFEVWPRFHTCSPFYRHDYKPFTIMLNASASANATANFIAAQLQLYLDNCDPPVAPISVTTTPLGGGQVKVCMTIPGEPVCKGNLFVCVQVPDVPPGGPCP